MKTTYLNFRAYRKKKQRAANKLRKPSALAGSIAAVAASLLSLSALPSDAATYTWLQTGAGPFNWDNSGAQDNWGTGIGGAFPTLQDDVAILSLADLTANQVINMTSAITIGTLQLGDALGSSVYTLAAGGGSLTFDVSIGSALLLKNHGGGGIAALNTMDTISTGVTLNSDLVINNALAGQGINITGIIDDGALAKSITKDGAGFVQLSGANTFDGGVTVNAGRLAVSLSNTAAGTDAITLNTGAQFDILNDTALTLANNFVIRGNSTINVDRAIGGSASNVAHTISGQVTLNNNTLAINNANGFTLTIAGQLNLSGAVSTISNGAPAVTLGSATGGKITGTGALNKVGGATLCPREHIRHRERLLGRNECLQRRASVELRRWRRRHDGHGCGLHRARRDPADQRHEQPHGPLQIAIQSSLSGVANVSQGPTGPATTTTGSNAIGGTELGRRLRDWHLGEWHLHQPHPRCRPAHQPNLDHQRGEHE